MKTTLLLVLSLIAYVEPGNGQPFSVMLGGGLSKDMRSATPNFWNMGLVVRGAFLAPGSGRVAFGGSLAFHSRGADGDGWVQETKSRYSFSSYSLTSVSGSQSVVELGPTVQFALSDQNSAVRPFIRAGVSILFISETDVTLRGSYTTSSSTGSGSITYVGQSLTGFGLQVGVPLIIAGRLEVQPAYSLYSAGGDLYHHYTVCASYVLTWGQRATP